MLHSFLLIVLGLILIVVLSAIFETVGLKNHPYVARILAGVCVVVGAYMHWGYHNWGTLLIIVAFAFAFLLIMREFLRPQEKPK